MRIGFPKGDCTTYNFTEQVQEFHFGVRNQISQDISSHLVYDLKFVGPLEFELIAPMPEQLKTTTMHFYEAPRKPY